ncbi:MAG: Hpt domain-containing protein, partial [Alphaproteobacteria bacterium]
GRFEKLPVLAMTANAMVEDRQEAQAAGMDDHISKPIDPSQMFATLLRWIPHGERELPEESGDEDPEVGAIPDLPGFQGRAGLDRMGGNAKTYWKLLATFVDNQAQAVEKIRAARDADDEQTVARLVHTLKGVAGNVGAVAVQEAALAYERNPGERSLSRLDHSLREVMDGLRPVLPSRDGKRPQGEATGAELLPVMHKLLAQLEDFDTEAQETMEELRLGVGDPAFGPLIDDLARHISRYDFEAAAVGLKGLLDRVAGGG